MLVENDYSVREALRADAPRRTLVDCTYFPRDHRTPENMRFRASRSLRPGRKLRSGDRGEIQAQRVPLLRTIPTIDEIYVRLENFRGGL